MDTLLIEDIALTLDVPVETLRSYAQRFALFVPAVRTGAELRYPRAGVTLLGEIADAVQAGAGFDEIEAALQTHIPVTVVDEPRTGTPIEEFRRLLDDQRRAIGELVAGLATADQFHGLRAETASLAAALAQRDSQLEHANALIVAELRVAFDALRQDIADLQAELQLERDQQDTDEATDPVEPPAPEPVVDQLAARPAGPPQRRATGRTPRRMGQPVRLNGVVQS